VSGKHVYMVPSRRLGRSLGVDLVPHKTCSFDCIYCQLGRTTELTVARRPGPPVEVLVDEVEEAIAHGPRPEFVTLSGSGEPTLYEPLGELIDALGRVFRPVAVLTNGSLLAEEKVRAALCRADVVLPSLDAADEETFQWVNRPHPDLTLQGLVEGMVGFRHEFRGEIWLEVMMLGGVTATPDQAARLARLAATIEPDRIHLNTVVRPPAEDYALPASRDGLHALCEVFRPHAEVIAESLPAADTPCSAVSSEAVLEILRRRPCTVVDLATALGVPSPGVVKILEALLVLRAVRVRARERQIFYSIAEGHKP
jgi:wyosine [tRNA(Phe)-imidazoG37] synthetase (radical SAM superfamily)